MRPFTIIQIITVQRIAIQTEIIKKYVKPGDYITTNGKFWNLDNHKMEKESLDVYCYDSYPYFAFGLDRNPLPRELTVPDAETVLPFWLSSHFHRTAVPK